MQETLIEVIYKNYKISIQLDEMIIKNAMLYKINVAEFFMNCIEEVREYAEPYKLINLNYVNNATLVAAFKKAIEYAYNSALIKDKKDVIELLGTKKQNIDFSQRLYDWSKKVGLEIPNKEYFTTTKELILDSLYIDTLPDEIRYMTQLETLSLWGCEFIVFPKIILELKALKKLDIFGNDIIDIPSLKILNNLEWLNIGNNHNITSIDFLEDNNKLKSFKMNNANKIQDFSPMQELHNLEIFHAVNCDLDSIPDSIFSLESLIELVLVSNNIKEIPLELFDFLRRLQVLDLNNNEIVDIPDSLYESILIMLNLASNKINKLDVKKLTETRIDCLKIDDNKELSLSQNDIYFLEKIDRCKY
jgi:Leucine-rich repeat (LRR) protein